MAVRGLCSGGLRVAVDVRTISNSPGSGTAELRRVEPRGADLDGVLEGAEAGERCGAGERVTLELLSRPESRVNTDAEVGSLLGATGVDVGDDDDGAGGFSPCTVERRGDLRSNSGTNWGDPAMMVGL